MEWAELALAVISGGGGTAAIAWTRARLRAPKIQAQANQIEDEALTSAWKALFDASNERGNDLEKIIAADRAQLSKLTTEITVAIQHRISCETRLQIAESQIESNRAELERMRVNLYELGLRLSELRTPRRKRSETIPTPASGVLSTHPATPATTGTTGDVTGDLLREEKEGQP